MDEILDALEREMSQVRGELRATPPPDEQRAAELLAALRRSETAWAAMLTPQTPSTPAWSAPHSGGVAPMGSVRDRAQQALSLIGVPAAPKTIQAVYEAFHGGALPARKLASMRRDEERSYANQPGSRAYLCPALTADRLTPARGLLTLSTWPLEQRVMASTSARADFLTMAARLAEAAQQLGSYLGARTDAVEHLLQRIALDILGADPAPERLALAAGVELAKVKPADAEARAEAADRARRLPTVQRLFGAAFED